MRRNSRATATALSCVGLLAGMLIAATSTPASAVTCTITGTSGPDTLVGGSGPDTICGLGGADPIVGIGGQDVLVGGPGNDTLVGGSDDDVHDPGEGTDTITENVAEDQTP